MSRPILSIVKRQWHNYCFIFKEWHEYCFLKNWHTYCSQIFWHKNCSHQKLAWNLLSRQNFPISLLKVYPKPIVSFPTVKIHLFIIRTRSLSLFSDSTIEKTTEKDFPKNLALFIYNTLSIVSLKGFQPFISTLLFQINQLQKIQKFGNNRFLGSLPLSYILLLLIVSLF